MGMTMEIFEDKLWFVLMFMLLISLKYCLNLISKLNGTNLSKKITLYMVDLFPEDKKNSPWIINKSFSISFQWTQYQWIHSTKLMKTNIVYLMISCYFLQFYNSIWSIFPIICNSFLLSFSTNFVKLQWQMQSSIQINLLKLTLGYL